MAETYYKDSNGNPYQSPSQQVIDSDSLIKISKTEFDTLVSNGNAIDPIKEYNASAQSAMDKSDVVVKRIVEAVSLGKTTFTTADVVAYMQYRSELRPEITAKAIGTLPTEPAYPANT